MVEKSEQTEMQGIEKNEYLEIIRKKLIPLVSDENITEEQIIRVASELWTKLKSKVSDTEILEWIEKQEAKKDWLAKVIRPHSKISFGTAMWWFAQGKALPLDNVRSSWTSHNKQ